MSAVPSRAFNCTFAVLRLRFDTKLPPGMNGCSSELLIFSLRGYLHAGQGSAMRSRNHQRTEGANAMSSKYAEIMQLHSHEPLTPFAHSSHNRCFGCGQANVTGLRLEFLLAPDGAVVSLPIVSDAFEGHPGFLHGGIIATLLDEAMSKAIRVLGTPSVTRTMEVEYLLPVPSGTRLRLEGSVVRSQGRRHWTEAVLLNAEGAALAQAKGLFIAIQPKAKK